jgi:hypothetical protein
MYRSTFSLLVGSEWSASGSGRFSPWDRTPGTHCIGGWVGPRKCPDNVERRKILPHPGTRTPTPGRQARSQSLYRLRYLGSQRN